MSGSMIYVPDSHIVQDEDELEAHARSSTMEYNKPDPDMVHASHVLITTTKVIYYFLSFLHAFSIKYFIKKAL